MFLKKVNRAKGTRGHYQADQDKHYKNPRSRERKRQKAFIFYFLNGWKLPKFDERHEFTH